MACVWLCGHALYTELQKMPSPPIFSYVQYRSGFRRMLHSSSHSYFFRFYIQEKEFKQIDRIVRSMSGRQADQDV